MITATMMRLEEWMQAMPEGVAKLIKQNSRHMVRLQDYINDKPSRWVLVAHDTDGGNAIETGMREILVVSPPPEADIYDHLLDAAITHWYEVYK